MFLFDSHSHNTYENKDLIETKKSQYDVQKRGKICEKQHIYYDKKVDFLIEKKELATNKKKSSSENRIEYLTELLKEGPTYACVICKRCMYQNGTKNLIKANTNVHLS